MGRFSRLMHPMPLPGRLPLAPCQFLLSPSLWLTAYLSTVKVVHWNTLYHFVLPLSRDFFFRLPLSSYHSAVNPLPVAFAMCGVLGSSATLSVHVLQITFLEIWTVCLAGVPSVSSLTVHIVSRRTPKINPKFTFLWGGILFA